MNKKLYYGAERERTIHNYNLHLANFYWIEFTKDFWQLPVLKPTKYIPEKLLGFNYAKSAKEKNVGIHFYLDDYQFQRVWQQPEKYLKILAEYDCVLSPDFSLYTDMPRIQQLYNVYRSRLIAAFWQRRGLTVIPTLQWAQRESFDFCFNGLPTESVVSVSTVGVMKTQQTRELWRAGMEKAIEKLKPKVILLYGVPLEFEHGNIVVKVYKNELTDSFRKRCAHAKN